MDINEIIPGQRLQTLSPACRWMLVAWSVFAGMIPLRPVALVTAETAQLLEAEFPLELHLECFSVVVCQGSGISCKRSVKST